VEYHRRGAPERPIVVKDPGTPAAYPSPISDVEMDLGDADDAGGTAECVGALGLIMDHTPRAEPEPASNSVTGVEVLLAARDGNGGDDSTAAVQVLIPGPVDVEMDGGSAETSLKTFEPEPERVSGETEEGNLRTGTDPNGTGSSATSNVSTQEVAEMCLGGGEGEGDDLFCPGCWTGRTSCYVIYISGYHYGRHRFTGYNARFPHLDRYCPRYGDLYIGRDYSDGTPYRIAQSDVSLVRNP
jgi:hypothetical protein